MSIYAERSKRILLEGQINPQNEKLYNQYKRAMTIKVYLIKLFMPMKQI